MRFIKNFGELAKTDERKVVLDLVEAGLLAIQPKNVLENNFFLEGGNLHIKEEVFDLSSINRIFLIGFGKGSSGISKIIENSLGDRLTQGYVIDTIEQTFSKIKFSLGTHPLPSQQNLDFTKNVLDNISGLSENDLILVVICGGGSALFEYPNSVTLEDLNKINKDLLNSGATISEINVIRKHLSLVKGGGLAKHLYPANVRSLIFSDVPGNDITVIASGPTAKDETSISDACEILKKYNLNLDQNLFGETVSDRKYFNNVKNIIVLSNLTALNAMKERAEKLGLVARILSSEIQGDAKEIGKSLIESANQNEVLLVGGETTVHVKGSGHGGRNQTLVVASLPYLDEKTIICSFDSDGYDFYYYCGAIGDHLSLEVAKEKNLDPKRYLDDDNTYEFLSKVGDGILTEKLESNVSDLMIIYKK